MKIHHNTLKKAKAHGISLEEDEAGYAARSADPSRTGLQMGYTMARAKDPKDALDLALRELAADAKAKVVKLKPKKAKTRRSSDVEPDDADNFDDEGEDEEEGDEGKSVIKRKYKMKYRPHKMTCGDGLAKQIRSEFMTLKDPDTRKPRLDWKRFTAFAKLNGCWSDGYSKLNAGMKRMNIVNRLRARAEAGDEIKWSV